MVILANALSCSMVYRFLLNLVVMVLMRMLMASILIMRIELAKAWLIQYDVVLPCARSVKVLGRLVIIAFSSWCLLLGRRASLMSLGLKTKALRVDVAWFSLVL